MYKNTFIGSAASRHAPNTPIVPSPARLAPKCKAPGIVVLVIGCVELSLMVVVITITRVSRGAPDSSAGDWWEPLLSGVGLLVTGTLAVAVSSGYPCLVAAIVMASLFLGWTVIKLQLITLLMGMVSLIAALDVYQGREVITHTSKLMDPGGLFFGISIALELTIFICMTWIIVTASRAVRSPQDKFIKIAL